MHLDAAGFRTWFPEFGATPGREAYADSRVNFWLGVGYAVWHSERWGDLHHQGIALYVAHHLTLDDRASKDAERGGQLGMVEGPRTQKSVGDVSAAYDTSAVTIENAAFYNLSTYGVQFYKLLKLVGMGGIQVI